MSVALFPYQQEDINHLEDQEAALVLSEMGTGKTVVAIARDLQIREQATGPTLVITKRAILEHWEDHYKRMAPDLKVCVLHQNERDRFIDDLRNLESDVYIVYWQMLRKPTGAERTSWARDVCTPVLMKQKWLHVIADELHQAKNRKAQQTWALKHLRTHWKTGLTGTPITSKPTDLWSLLNWVDKKEYSSFWRFFERYVEYEEVPPLNYKVPKGVINDFELRSKIAPFSVRRRKLEVLPDLPSVYTNAIHVDLDPKQLRAYTSLRDDMVAWVGEHEDRQLSATIVIAKLQRLQQLAIAHLDLGDTGKVSLIEPSSKLDAIEEILEEHDGQLVIFSQFASAIRLLERRLKLRGEKFGTLIGATPDDERRLTIDRFQSGDLRVFAGTIGAGGEGIDLHAASTVLFIDRSWSPTANDQAISRLHRYGQLNAVQVIDIIARKTMETKKQRDIELKADWIRRLLGDG
jgi:SNF2 family DNA or RNA helicase